MSIFKVKGFDSVISKDMHLAGELSFSGTVVIDGTIDGQSVKQNHADTKPSLLHINGNVKVKDVVIIHDLTVCGTVEAREIRVEGTFAVKSGCKVSADVIYYRTLEVEPGAIIMAQMKHLDHVSEGEQV